MPRGALIVFEGASGCGKSTQAHLLVNRLKAQKLEPKYFCSPRGEELGPTLYRRFCEYQVASPQPGLESVLLANRKMQHEILRDYLDRNMIVIVERYVYTQYAYAVSHGASVEFSRAGCAGAIKPDLLVHMSASPFLIARRAGTELTDVDDRVLNGYYQLEDAVAIGDARRITVDGTASIEQEHIAIRCAVNDMLTCKKRVSLTEELFN